MDTREIASINTNMSVWFFPTQTALTQTDFSFASEVCRRIWLCEIGFMLKNPLTFSHICLYYLFMSLQVMCVILPLYTAIHKLFAAAGQCMIFVLIFLSCCGCPLGLVCQCVPTCLKCWITSAGLLLISLTSHHGQTLHCLTCQWHTTDCYWLAPLLLLAKFITGSTKVARDITKVEASRSTWKVKKGERDINK